MENYCCIPKTVALTQNGLFHSVRKKQRAPGLWGKVNNVPLNHMSTHMHISIKPWWRLTGLSWLCLPGSGDLPTVEVAIVCIVPAHLVVWQGLADSSYLIWLCVTPARAVDHVSKSRDGGQKKIIINTLLLSHIMFNSLSAAYKEPNTSTNLC